MRPTSEFVRRGRVMETRGNGEALPWDNDTIIEPLMTLKSKLADCGHFMPQDWLSRNDMINKVSQRRAHPGTVRVAGHAGSERFTRGDGGGSTTCKMRHPCHRPK